MRESERLIQEGNPETAEAKEQQFQNLSLQGLFMECRGKRNRITARFCRAGPGEGFVAGGKQALVVSACIILS